MFTASFVDTNANYRSNSLSDNAGREQPGEQPGPEYASLAQH